MATLTKSINLRKVVMGWYGECAGEDCVDINLSTFKDNLFAVWQLTNEGQWRGWSASTPEFINQPIMKFECGMIYFLVLKSGQGSFTIPNFVASTFGSSDLGRVASSCEPTPTPVLCTCAPANFAVTTATSATHNALGHVFVGFQNNEEISFDDSSLVSEGMAATITLMYPGSSQAGVVILQGHVPNNTRFYIKHGIDCYTAVVPSDKNDGENWKVTLSFTEKLSSNCGDDIELPTPTPTHTPAIQTQTPV